jgi:hypothetical protein
MKMKFGAIVVDGRGKIGGHVASKNRSCAYLRTKVTPVNPNTSSQASVRGTFTDLSQGWRSLTQAQRDAWNAAVAGFATTNIFGDLKNPSGFNLYQRLNNNLISIGEAAIASPPLPSAVGSCVVIGITINTTGSIFVMSFNPDPVPADTAVKVFATSPQSAGKSFAKSEYRQISVMGAAQAAPYDLSNDYISKFGSLGSAGQKIFVKVLPINSVTGQAGAVSSISELVTTIP